MKSDLFFRACTRPAMFLGVPVIPFLINVGISVALTFYVSLLFVPELIISHLFLQYLAKKDELIFDNFALWFMTKMLCLRNVKTLDSSTVICHGPGRSNLQNKQV